MAFQTMWYFTDLPGDVIDCIEKDLTNQFDQQLEESKLSGDVVDVDRRSSTNAWVPTTHWVSGFVWHYISKANRENFLYDLTHVDGETMQYTRYKEGDYYKWHTDAGIGTSYKPQASDNYGNKDIEVQDFLTTSVENIRKLSFILQLSDAEDYEGGNVQFLDDNRKSFFAPRKKGTMILFDSRTQHRVLKVTKGIRKSLVGWTSGPRWK
jgi:PKHD-type hydroxylase